MIRNIPILYIVGPLAAACLAAAGVVTEIPVLAYAIPAVISGVMAISVIWRFAKYKQNLSFLVLYAGTFLLFHFQLCSPAYWSNFTAIMPEYSVEARLLGVVGANLLPVAGVWTMLLLDMFCPLKAVEINRGPESASRYNETWLFGVFIGLFVLVAIPNIFFGGVFLSSINAILTMRGTMDEGGVMIESRLASLLSANQFACSLVVLSLALYRSKYRLAIFVLALMSTIWAAASVFAMGNRTQVLQFGVFFLVTLVGSPKTRPRGLIMAGVAGIFIFILAQIMTNYRDVGLKEINASEFVGKVTDIQGLETLHDQTRAFEMFLEGYHNPASFGIAPVDFVYGLIYRPIELLMYPLPRSFFPWKPVDPTLHDLNVWAITRMGVNPEEHEWGLTAGLLGRDALRWGMFGPFVALFWFSVLCWYAEREYARDRWSLNQRLVAGAFAGTAMAMFRDLSPLWCLQLIPAATIIMIARRPFSRFSRRPESLQPLSPAKPSLSRTV